MRELQTCLLLTAPKPIKPDVEATLQGAMSRWLVAVDRLAN
jgi:hypothetical protein